MANDNTILNRVIYHQDDLETPSATRKFPLGSQVQHVDDTTTTKPYASTLEYIQAGTTMQQYGVYGIVGNASGITASLVTNSVTAMAPVRVCVPQTNITNGYYCFAAVRGVCTMAHTAGAGVSMSTGNNFRITQEATTPTPCTVSQASGTAPTVLRTIDAIGFASGLSGTSANMSVYLFGDPILLDSPGVI